MAKRCVALIFILLAFLCVTGVAGAEQVTITGQVLGPDGQPMAGAQVLVQYCAPGRKEVTQMAETDADGRFALTCEVRIGMDSSLNVAARRPGLAVDWAAVNGGQRVTLRLGAEPATVSGTVRDPEGNAIVGAEAYISLLRRLPGDERVRPMTSPGMPMPEFLSNSFFLKDRTFLSAVTDNAGWFEIPDLPPDQQVGLTVLAEGRERWTMEDKTISAGTHDVEVVLRQQAVISGRITREGQPARAIAVWCSMGGRSRARTVSSEDGVYELAQLSPGTYTVIVDLPEGLTAAPIDQINLEAGESAADTNVVLTPGGLVKGTVTDRDTGRPLAGVSLSVCSANRLYPRTDNDGNYVQRLPSGHYEVSCNLGGPALRKTESPRRTVKVVEGKTVAGVDFLVYQVRLHGQVLLPDGQPAVGVAVIGPAAGFSQDGVRVFAKTQSDAHGNFQFELERKHGSKRPWVVWARDPDKGLAGAAFVDNPEEPVEIRLAEGGYIAAQVVDLQGEPVPDFHVRVNVSRRNSLLDISWMRSDDRGEMRAGPLPAEIPLGVYAAGKMDAFTLNNWSGLQPVTLAPGEERVLPPLRVNPTGRSLKGWVGDEQQQPVKDALVFALGIEQPVVADQSGYFELTGLRPKGELWIAAVHPEEALFAAEQLDPDWGFRVNLVLRPLGQATGQVVDNQGQAVEGAKIFVSGPSGFSWGMDEMWPLERRLGAHGWFQETVTDWQGKWRVEGLIGGGEYQVSVWARGHEDYRHYAVTARGGETVDVGQMVLKE